MNYAAILSIESSSVDGYFYKYDKGSLGHVLMPSSSDWASDSIVWSMSQAQEWQSRMMNAGVAWTWSIKLETGDDR